MFLKSRTPVHTELSINDIPIAMDAFTKHIGVYLDSRLNFSKDIKEKLF